MTRKARPRKTYRTFWLIAALCALSAIAYWNSFGVPLVFDDLLTVQKNAGVRFGEFNWNLLAGRSILYLTFTLNYVWTEQDVWSYHLINLLFHSVNGILIFLIAGQVFKRVLMNADRIPAYAFGAAGVFLLHPVQTESVTYISSRSELLSTVFYLTALLMFVKRDENRIGFAFSLLISVPFLFALSSKETAISLPAILVLYDLIFLSRGSIRGVLSRWRFYSTFVVGGAAAAYYIATVTLRGSIGGNLKGHLSPFHYFLTQLRVMVRYVYLTFFPVGLNLDYDFPPSTSVLEWKVIASFLFLAGLVVLGWRMRRTYPVYSFSVLCFFLALAPTSSVVPILDVIFEHRLYLPMVGVCLSFPFLFAAAAGRVRAASGFQIKPSVLGGFVLGAFLVGTIMRNHVWGDEVRLFTDVVEKSPGKDRGYNSLAWAYYKRGDYDSAIKVGQKASERLVGQKADFAEMLGNMYLKAGRYDEGIQLFKDIIPLQTEPDRIAFAYNNLGVAYLYKWQALQLRQNQMSPADFAAERAKILEPAAEAFKRCYEMDNGMLWAWDSYINVSWYMQRVDTIEKEALGRLGSDEETFQDLYAVAKAAFWREDYARAHEFFERAEADTRPNRLVYFNHAYSLNKIGRVDDAIDKYLAAIREDPIFVEAHHNVGLLYIVKNEDDRAVSHLSEVLRYDPAHRSSHLNLAKVFARRGNKPDAKAHLEMVLKTSPGDQEVVQLWQQLGL